ncbi:uncharacterized protein LOC115634119 [Scaptodrosophila lebanonensis]|uniref:Uncharacterized protein LOC115634119 n=1 Tax=Drosophila lebanonensis TaxID=7225 RepID=A0A6J2UGF7_DROLE|nr:uncharacterized protein LOC115634119 [Scaptodrosophila lebanonensis]
MKETIGTNANSSHSDKELLVRKERWIPYLIYPRTHPSRLQMIAGFGIPVEDLYVENVLTGYVLKAQYYLPSTAKQLRTKNLHSITEPRQEHYGSNASFFEQMLAKSESELDLPEMKPDINMNSLSRYRWAAYKGFEALGLRMKLNGRECVLKSICESAMTPFDERNGLLGELLHILLTPSSSKDALSVHTDNDYLHAEQLGHKGADCDQVYSRCPKSLLQHFSDVHAWGSDILKMLGG